MRNLGGQVSGLPQLLDILFRNGGGHPPALKAGSGLWVLDLEAGEGFDRVREEKRTGLGLFIKRVNIKRPPSGRLGLA